MVRRLEPAALLAGWEPMNSAGGEAQEAAQRHQSARSGGDGQRSPGALRSGAQPREVALITTQDVAIQFGDVRNASVAAGEITEPPQVTAVALDRPGRSVPIK